MNDAYNATRKLEVATLLSMIDGIDEVIYVADPDTHELLHVNRTGKNAWGEDIEGKKCYKALQNRDSPCPFCTNNIIFGEKLGETHVWEFQNQVNKHWYRCSDKAIPWLDGRMVRFELAMDITAIKESAHQLWLKDIVFENSIAANSIAGIDGAITIANQAFLDMWGYDTLEEVIGKSIADFFADPNETGPVMEALATEGKWAGDFMGLGKDGSTFLTKGNAIALKNEAGELIGYHSTNIDVTNERKYLTEIQSTNQKMESMLRKVKLSNKELEQFAYVASHDLQEPLRKVKNFTQLFAQRYSDKVDDKGQQYINYIVDGSNRMQLLIEDLLLYSRVQTRGGHYTPVNADQVLEVCLGDIDNSIQKNQAEVTKDSLPQEIVADGRQIGQLFQNLILNAIKFKGAEYPKIHIGYSLDGTNHHFTITDNGKGINPQYQKQIFVIFQRLHCKEEYPGSGIGLAICKRIVERHKGKIWVESDGTSGSTFHFTIPTNLRINEGGNNS